MRLLTFLEYTAIVIGAIANFAGRHFGLANGRPQGQTPLKEKESQ